MNLYSKISFPVYRKYRNGQSWFRINGPESFEEIRLFGSGYLWTKHEAKTLPDRNFVHDLVLDYESFAEVINAEEYDRIAALLT